MGDDWVVIRLKGEGAKTTLQQRGGYWATATDRGLDSTPQVTVHLKGALEKEMEELKM